MKILMSRTNDSQKTTNCAVAYDKDGKLISVKFCVIHR